MYGLIGAVLAAAVGLAFYIIRHIRQSEIQKYYEAARQILKEKCLNQAIKNQSPKREDEKKIMIYLKWKDTAKQGYVFDPKEGVRIGRAPDVNEICVREQEVSARHCCIYLAGGRLAVQDLHSSNGTWIRRGLRKRMVRGAEYLYSGDRVLVGSLSFLVTVFTFDMRYL